MENKNYFNKLIIIPFVILIILTGYFGYEYYLKNRYTTIDPQDVENQVNYSEGTKKLLDRKPFLNKLPYTSDAFDVYYSTVNDEVQIIMKNKGVSYEEAKQIDSVPVAQFLQDIGVNTSTQKVTWLLQQ